MAEFVLVHGSGQHSGCWDRVAALLRGAGHVVAAPDLPKTAAGSGLLEQAQVVAAAVRLLDASRFSLVSVGPAGSPRPDLSDLRF